MECPMAKAQAYSFTEKKRLRKIFAKLVNIFYSSNRIIIGYNEYIYL